MPERWFGLRGSEHKLLFEIEDDGQGDDVESHAGNGFLNMTDRIAALGEPSPWSPSLGRGAHDPRYFRSSSRARADRALLLGLRSGLSRAGYWGGAQ